MTGRVPCPSTVNAELDTVSCEMATELNPLFEIEIFSFAEAPTLTVPKSSEEGEATRFAAALPVEDPFLYTTPHPASPITMKPTARNAAIVRL